MRIKFSKFLTLFEKGKGGGKIAGADFMILSVIGIWIQWRQLEATAHMTSAS